MLSRTLLENLLLKSPNFNLILLNYEKWTSKAPEACNVNLNVKWNIDVKNLILTHFSARYKDEKVLLNEAKTIHNSVIAANDQLKIDVV